MANSQQWNHQPRFEQSIKEQLLKTENGNERKDKLRINKVVRVGNNKNGNRRC